MALVAKYGFAGPEQWQQLDTSLNSSPTDTMWALRVPVCLDAACSQSMPVYVAHWYGTGANGTTSYNNQALNLHTQGKTRDAEPLYRQALAIREEVLGPKHPATAASYNYLAANLERMAADQSQKPEHLLGTGLEARPTLLPR